MHLFILFIYACTLLLCVYIHPHFFAFVRVHTVIYMYNLNYCSFYNNLSKIVYI